VPTRPAGKGRLRVNKTSGSGKGEMKQGEKLNWMSLHSYLILNFITLGGAGSQILTLIWADTLGRNFDIKIGNATREACNAKWQN
jgi:hypothetical protein